MKIKKLFEGNRVIFLASEAPKQESQKAEAAKAEKIPEDIKESFVADLDDAGKSLKKSLKSLDKYSNLYKEGRKLQKELKKISDDFKNDPDTNLYSPAEQLLKNIVKYNSDVERKKEEEASSSEFTFDETEEKRAYESWEKNEGQKEDIKELLTSIRDLKYLKSNTRKDNIGERVYQLEAKMDEYLQQGKIDEWEMQTIQGEVEVIQYYEKIMRQGFNLKDNLNKNYPANESPVAHKYLENIQKQFMDVQQSFEKQDWVKGDIDSKMAVFADAKGKVEELNEAINLFNDTQESFDTLVDGTGPVTYEQVKDFTDNYYKVIDMKDGLGALFNSDRIDQKTKDAIANFFAWSNVAEQKAPEKTPTNPDLMPMFEQAKSIDQKFIDLTQQLEKIMQEKGDEYVKYEKGILSDYKKIPEDVKALKQLLTEKGGDGAQVLLTKLREDIASMGAKVEKYVQTYDKFVKLYEGGNKISDRNVDNFIDKRFKDDRLRGLIDTDRISHMASYKLAVHFGLSEEAQKVLRDKALIEVPVQELDESEKSTARIEGLKEFSNDLIRGAMKDMDTLTAILKEKKGIRADRADDLYSDFGDFIEGAKMLMKTASDVSSTKENYDVMKARFVELDKQTRKYERDYHRLLSLLKVDNVSDEALLSVIDGGVRDDRLLTLVGTNKVSDRMSEKIAQIYRLDDTQVAELKKKNNDKLA